MTIRLSWESFIFDVLTDSQLNVSRSTF